jgi:hypothetical protein
MFVLLSSPASSLSSSSGSSLVDESKFVVCVQAKLLHAQEDEEAAVPCVYIGGRLATTCPITTAPVVVGEVNDPSSRGECPSMLEVRGATIHDENELELCSPIPTPSPSPPSLRPVERGAAVVASSRASR